LIGQYGRNSRINIVFKENCNRFMSARDIEELNNRLRNVRIETEALRLEEEALVPRIAYIEAQERVHEATAPQPIAIGDRVRILNPGPGRRRPRDTVGQVLSITAHFVTVRTNSNLIVKRVRHNVQCIDDNRIDR
jgi:hypothetical protein